MELDELSRAWQGLTTGIDRRPLALDRLPNLAQSSRFFFRLRLLAWGQVVQLAIGLVVVVWAGGYWTERLQQPVLFTAGLLLHGWGLALLIAGVAQLVRLADIDERQPVLQLRCRLLALRKLRFSCERVLLPLGAAIWWPILAITLDLFGRSAWLSSAVVFGNAAAGVVLAVTLAWLMRRYRDFFERDAAGRSLREAEAELDELLSPQPPGER